MSIFALHSSDKKKTTTGMFPLVRVGAAHPCEVQVFFSTRSTVLAAFTRDEGMSRSNKPFVLNLLIRMLERRKGY